MPRKKTQARTKERKPSGTRRTGNPATEIMGSYVRSSKILQDTWNDFVEHMENRILEGYQNQQKTYQDFYNKWMEFTQKMGSRISKTRPGDKYREAYDVWKNYANRMNHRLTKVMTNTRQFYERLDKHWRDRYQTLSEEMAKFSTGEIKPQEFKAIHEAWNGFTCEMEEYINSSTDMSTEELEEITHVWLDFSNKMYDFVKQLGEDGEEAKDFTGLWMDTSKELGQSLKKMLKENSLDLENLQKTWSDYCSKMEKEIVRTTKNMGLDFEDLWEAYFTNQRRWYGWWNFHQRERDNGLMKAIDKLEKRVEALEKKSSK